MLELIPPRVQADLQGSSHNPRAMPLPGGEFICATMKVLGSDAEESLAQRAKTLRNNVGPEEFAFVTESNDIVRNGLTEQIVPQGVLARGEMATLVHSRQQNFPPSAASGRLCAYGMVRKGRVLARFVSLYLFSGAVFFCQGGGQPDSDAHPMPGGRSARSLLWPRAACGRVRAMRLSGHRG